MQEAQAAANNGVAAIGISEDKIVVLSATDEEQPVAQTASVMTLSENTSAYAVAGLEYYSYSYATTNYCILVDGWLRLYVRPTVSCGGRTVSIPNVPQYVGSDGVIYKFTNKEYWSTRQPAMATYSINKWAFNQIIEKTGAEPIINVGPKGDLTDGNGRYWVAVGPNVVNPNHQPNATPTPSEMYANGVLDVVLRDKSGNVWYMPAVVGGTKAHTWQNGVIQTWKKFPDGGYDSAKKYGLNGNEYNGTVAVEFIGVNSAAVRALNTGEYEIVEIIFYDN